MKRYRGEVEKAKEFSISKFAKDLLDVKDDLELAMKYTNLEELKEEKDPEKLYEALKQLFDGVTMTAKSFDRTMGNYGITEYSPVGEDFDPHWHEAMFMMPDLTKKAGTVGQVLQRGWKIGDRCLRAAKVGCVTHDKK